MKFFFGQNCLQLSHINGFLKIGDRIKIKEKKPEGKLIQWDESYIPPPVEEVVADDQN